MIDPNLDPKDNDERNAVGDSLVALMTALEKMGFGNILVCCSVDRNNVTSSYAAHGDMDLREMGARLMLINSRIVNEVKPPLEEIEDEPWKF